MWRLPPSVLVHEELDRLLHGGVDIDTNVISAPVETATRLVVQQLLEADQADFLAAGAVMNDAVAVSGGGATGINGVGSEVPRGRSRSPCPRCATPASRIARA